MRDVLIHENTLWPPLGHEKLRTRWQSWAAWWSGDLDQLRTHTPCTAPGGYWARRKAKPEDRQIHLPIAADIARTSAELVYGDTPAMDWGEAPKETPGEEKTPTAPGPVQTAWDDISQRIGWANSLLEAGEVGAALGGVYLRPVWDSQTAERPLLTIVRADEALPEFRFGALHSVTFVDEIPAPAHWKEHKTAETWRHLEHHEPGVIRHELWHGTTTNIGNLVPLTEHPATAYLESEIPTTEIRRTGLLVEYVPNDLPQPLDRLPLGRSDFQGIETLLDALDETWASWMRDLDLGKARVLLSREMLDPVGQSSSRGGRFLGRGGSKSTPAAAFDKDAEVFSPLEMPAEDGGKVAPITLVQFKIRVQEHAATFMALLEQCISRAGYAPQTFGINVDGQLSGTAMRRRDQRSHRTKGRKRRYARSPLERLAETIMLLNAKLFNGPAPAQRPTLTWRETDQSDPTEMAETIYKLRQAQVLSIRIAVEMAHPEWDKQQVDDEVARLEREDALLRALPPTGFEPPAGSELPPYAAPNQPPGLPPELDPETFDG